MYISFYGIWDTLVRKAFEEERGRESENFTFFLSRFPLSLSRSRGRLFAGIAGK